MTEQAASGGQERSTTEEGTETEPTEPSEPTDPAAAEGGDGTSSDPLTDPETRRREAHVDTDFPFGRPGRPLPRSSPIVFGFSAAVGALLAWFALQLLVSARGVIILIVVALFLAVGLNPAVERLRSRGIRRGLAVTAVFLALLGGFVGFGFAVAPPLTEQIAAFVQRIPEWVNQLQNNPTVNQLDQRYELLDRAEQYLTTANLGQQLFGGIVGFGRAVLGTLFNVVTVLILTLYFLVSLPGIKRTAYHLAPRSRRARVSLLSDEMLARIGGYISGVLIISALAGTTAFIFLEIIGLKYALALALVVALFVLIPVIGATLGAVIVTLVGLSESLGIAVACAIFFVAYQQVENYLIYPRIMKRSVDVPPTATIIAVLVGGALLGVVGALLAIPTAAAIRLMLDHVVVPRQDGR